MLLAAGPILILCAVGIKQNNPWWAFTSYSPFAFKTARFLFRVLLIFFSGEKMTDEEVDTLLSGVEDNQGQVNYEGRFRVYNIVVCIN